MVNQSFIMLTLVVDGKTQLDKVAEINGKRFYANARFMYIYSVFSCTNNAYFFFKDTLEAAPYTHLWPHLLSGWNPGVHCDGDVALVLINPSTTHHVTACCFVHT
jgi:hypothetical protein